MIAWFTHPTLEALSLTGHEASPSWYGGSADFAQLGLYHGGGPVEGGIGFVKRILVSLASRSLFILYLTVGILSFLVIRRSRSVRRLAVSCGITLIVLYFVPSLVMAASIHRVDRFVAVDRAGPSADCRLLHYTVRLSPEFRQKISAVDAPDARLELSFRPAEQTPDIPVVKFGARAMVLRPGDSAGLWRVEEPDWRAVLRDADTIDLVQRSDRAIHYHGWQKNGLPDRVLNFSDCVGAVNASATVSNALPALELRVRVPGDAVIFAGF